MSPSGNFIKTDDELKGLMDKLESVNSYRAFTRWKATFLKRFETFLTESGMGPSQDAYAAYGKEIAQMEKFVNTVQKHVDKGDLSAEKTTVKGRNALNEMCKKLQTTTVATRDLIPSTGAEEKKRKYTKYELACVLIKDNFSEYSRMDHCNKTVQEMKIGCLEHIANPQQLQMMEGFNTQLERFRAVMNDLGLYDVMQKCLLYGSGENTEIILIDPKLGCLIEMPRTAALDKKILTVRTSDDGKELINEAETDFKEKELLKETIRKTLKIGA